MVMDLTRLSSNLINIIDEVLKNRELVNLIGYNGNFPILPPNTPIDPKDIAPKGINEKIFPYPFDIAYEGDVSTQLHIYYPNFQFKNNGYANEIILIFDVVVHKSIWLMMDNSKKVIRPYQIVNQLVNTFKGKRIGQLGEIHFIDGSHTLINSQFEGIRLVAKFTEF
jgi:hypothetical protein